MNQKNSNLHRAKAAKCDEFYTQLPDIEQELKHYEEHFKDKVVYANCDAEWSNFVVYFKQNAERLGIKEFIYSSTDFRENLDLLKKADIVVTNPPFSLFREFVEVLVANEKKFLIVGNTNATTYKEVFKHIKDNELWWGVSPRSMNFVLPNKEIKAVNAVWYTNMTHNKRNEELILCKKYNEKDYPKYDNYDAIEVSKVCEIPMDYKGVMGVPITFLTKYNPDQFEILGIDRVLIEELTGKVSRCFINGKEVYARILIKRRGESAKTIR